MPTYKASWTGAKTALEAAETALTEVLWPPAEAVSLIKDDPANEDEATGWRLEAYFESRPEPKALKACLAEAGPISEAAIEELPDIDWVAHALEGLGVVRAGRFVLHGVHDADKLPNEEGDVPIRIDANQAFGTGHHPTTAGCLTLLHRLAGVPPHGILDLGAGSAVLAIAAAKLWGEPVLATDIDEKSVEIARENIAINGAADLVEVEVADGFDNPKIEEAAPFEFIFANILAGPLKEFAPGMAARTARGGRVMLAGLMSEQEKGVVEAYEAAGFKKLNRLDHKVWPVLLFVKL